MKKILIAGVMAACSTLPAYSASAQTENDAMDLCEAAVIRAATNRSSVKFKSPYPLPRVTELNNMLIVYTKFTAKNGYGAESMMLARCTVTGDGGKLIDMTTQDIR